MKNRFYSLAVVFMVLASGAYAQFVAIDTAFNADALRDTLKAKGLSDAEVDQAFLKYVNAGYNLKDVKVAMEAKYAMESMSDVEKIAYLQEHFSSSVSHLKNDYGLADADILKLSDLGVPLKSVYGKLTRISEDAGMGRDVARWTADAIRNDVIQVDDVSLFDSAQVISHYKDAIKEGVETNPLSTNAGLDQIIEILGDQKGVANVIVKSEEKTVDGVTILTQGTRKIGWLHLKLEHITGDIPGGDLFKDLFPEITGTEEKTVKVWMQDAIKKGTAKGLKAGENQIGYILEPYNDGRKMAVVVEYEFESLGSTQAKVMTSFPCITKPDCFNPEELI